MSMKCPGRRSAGVLARGVASMVCRTVQVVDRAEEYGPERTILSGGKWKYALCREEIGVLAGSAFHS